MVEPRGVGAALSPSSKPTSWQKPHDMRDHWNVAVTCHHHQGLWLQLAVPLVVGALAQALAAELVSQVATLLLIGKWLP